MLLQAARRQLPPAAAVMTSALWIFRKTCMFHMIALFCSRSRQRADRFCHFIAISPDSSPHFFHRIPLQPAVHHQQPTTGAVHHQQPTTAVHYQQPTTAVHHQQSNVANPYHQTVGAAPPLQQPNVGNPYHQTQAVGAAPTVRFDLTPVMHSGETPNVQNMGGRGPLRNPYT
jgi:hypothetical protein